MAIPLLIAGGVAAAAAAGGTIGATALAKSGSGPGPSWNHAKGGNYDPNAFQYSANGMRAGERTQMYDALAEQAQQREAAQAGYGQANQWLGRNSVAEQDQALELQRQAAMGQTPSFAALQLQAGQDAAARSQEAMRASARGASGVALADYNAAANVAAGQQATNAQAGMLRAQEMAQARDAYMAGASGARGQDMGTAGMTAGWEQFNIGQQMQQRGMNDQRDAAMRAASEGVAGTQLQANIANQAALQRAYEERERLKQAKEAGAAAASSQAVSAGLGGLSGAASALGSAYYGGTKPPPGKG